MRILPFVLGLAMLQPGCANAGEPPYYGPMKPWHGIGFKFGFKDEAQKDGTWRVTAATHSGEAIDMAMYRAAELARQQGFAYVEFLGGSASQSPGINSATVDILPSQSPAAPTACRSHRRGTCYTADVTEVLRILGGPGGTQPGVAIVDHFDAYGRAVIISGFGIADASALAARSAPVQPVPAPPAPAASVPAVPAPTVPGPAVAAWRYAPAGQRATAGVAASGTRDREADARFRQALKAVQPVSRDPKLGWTMTD